MPFRTVCLALLLAWSSPSLGQSPQAPTTTLPSLAPRRVALVPLNLARHDSVLFIIGRDLSLTGLLAPRLSYPSFSTLTPNFDALAVEQIPLALTLGLTTQGLQVALFDVPTKKLINSAHFNIPREPTSRLSYLRDSVSRAFIRRDQLIARDLERAAFLRDSLTTASARRPSRASDSLRQEAIMTYARLRTLAEANASRRDSLLLSLPYLDSLAQAQAQVFRRFTLHAVADRLHLWLTGHQGYASSRLAFISQGQLRVIDADGHNHRILTPHGQTVLSPSWHPLGSKIIYTTLTSQGTQITETDLSTGHSRELSSVSRGLNLTPIYTKNGQDIIFAHDQGSFLDLFITSFSSASPPTRLFSVPEERMSPVLSPNGAHLLFVSPKIWMETKATPQLFTANLSTRQVSQLLPTTYGQRTYRTSPDWSPDGRFIAYMQQHGDFQVWLLDLVSRQTSRLTYKFEHEDPTFAPNSRYLAVASNRSGQKEIWILDTQTTKARQLTFTGEARLPAWSPLLSPSQAAATY